MGKQLFGKRIYCAYYAVSYYFYRINDCCCHCCRYLDGMVCLSLRNVMLAQMFAVVIFLAMFILIITEVWERHIVTLGCALLTLILVFGICMHSPSAIIETLNIHSIFSPGFWHTAGEASEASAGINWEHIDY